MSKLVKKVFGRGKGAPGAPAPGPGSQPLTGIDPMRGQQAQVSGERRRGGRRGGDLGGGRTGLGANTVLSRTY